MPKSPDYKLTWRPPFEITIDFSDGRQAQLLTERIPTFHLSEKIDLTESTCSGFMPQKTSCEFHVPVRSQILALVWSIYPGSPEKIGQTIQIKRAYLNYKDNKSVVEFQPPEDLFVLHDAADESTIYLQKNILESEKWNLTCDEKNLFSPFLNTAGKLEVLSIASENNQDNPETRLAENRSSESLENLNFNLTSSGYKLESVGNSTSQTTVLFAQNHHWVMSKKNNEICELSFSVESDKFLNLISEFQDRKPNLQKLKPITWLSVGSETKKTINTLNSLLKFDGLLE